ncbi:MAG: glycosyltransferase family 1 protein, partial [Candidatus Daviesbacteria bacterium]|nr:glycosyltransferase family 1 protein [Candidatus Daviesbacteria bacterium]
MRIVLDARMYQESGIGRYIRNLIFHLGKLDTKNQYLILHLKNDFHRLEYNKNFSKILADFKWYGVAEQIRLPGLLKSLNPDIVHFPHFNVPIFYKG